MGHYIMYTAKSATSVQNDTSNVIVKYISIVQNVTYRHMHEFHYCYQFFYPYGLKYCNVHVQGVPP